MEAILIIICVAVVLTSFFAFSWHRFNSKQEKEDKKPKFHHIEIDITGNTIYVFSTVGVNLGWIYPNGSFTKNVNEIFIGQMAEIQYIKDNFQEIYELYKNK